MHIRRLRARSYRRFHDLTLELPTEPRLVVLCGPNGMGKSSLIDAVGTWHRGNSGEGWGGDEHYFKKAGEPALNSNESVGIEFAEPTPTTADDLRKIVYARSAYRHEADFSMSSLQRTGDIYAAPRAYRMIEPEAKVSDNYQRIASQAMEDLFGGSYDGVQVGELREMHVGTVRSAILSMFPDLHLEGPGNPLDGGTFYFRKAGAPQFHYKNLSGGEKAAFDLVLDIVVKSAAYGDAVYFIDEPELHLNTRLQGALLDTILGLLSPSAQLWIATHSIGMMRKAQTLHEAEPGSVAFFDFEHHDFDQPVSLKPVAPTREFWTQQLEVALGDLAKLIAPDCVVLCEGRPARDGARAEFDARCYREIFGTSRPRTDFVSVGNAVDVQKDRVELGRAILTLISGTKLIRVIDRDMRSDNEVREAQANGVRVLRRRHLEAYLLDDEVLTALASSVGRPELTREVIAAKKTAIDASVERGNDSDDIKSAAGEFYTAVRQLLSLVAAGNTADAFLADTLAPLITSEMKVYTELAEEIFGN